MKITIKHFATAVFATSLLLAACKKDEKTNPPSPTPAPPPNEQELITTFKLYLNDGTNTAVYTFKDPDGEGGIPAFYGPGTTTASTQSDSVIVLIANTSYTATLYFLDESKADTDTISYEIEEEADEHMVFFNQTNPSALPNASVAISGSNLSITYLDNDGATPPLPLGLITSWQTGNAAGKVPLVIDLKHQPETKNGTYAPGDTDISVLFKVMIN